jgi:hypothetical protein
MPSGGHFIDWITRQWVVLTGRPVNLAVEPWLAGPIAPASGISTDFFQVLAEREGLTVAASENCAGLVETFSSFEGPTFDPRRVDARVRNFYEQTGDYELDAWAAWSGVFRPFGWLLAVLFSRRLQQLNVPLSGLDTAQGMTNEILLFRDATTASLRHTVWLRHLVQTGNVLYAAFYSICEVPAASDPCMKVVFPLPHGNAIVIMRTEAQPDGSLLVTSAGQKHGSPGFYFTVRQSDGTICARYIKSLRESIHVYPNGDGELRADHVLTFFGLTFLRLHYRMRRRPTAVAGITAGSCLKPNA